MHGSSDDESAGPLSNLDPNRLAFRGWSGSAQMVSWLINQDARGKLPGLKSARFESLLTFWVLHIWLTSLPYLSTVGAGIMMAGGSHACYNWPGHGAINQCANCNVSERYRYDPQAFGCSSTAAARGVEGGQVRFGSIAVSLSLCLSLCWGTFWTHLSSNTSCVAILRAVLPDELHGGLLCITPREVRRTPADVSDPDRARLRGGLMRGEALSRDDARARSA
jgi:hypothetical protein